MSKKKILKAILLALSVLLTERRNLRSSTMTLTHTRSRGLPVWEALYFSVRHGLSAAH